MTAIAVTYQRDCPVPPSQMAEWQRQLEQAVPRYQRGMEELSFLLLRWHAGDPWAPIGRYVVWQVWPRGIVPLGPEEGILQELAGPHPRSEGHFCGGADWCPTADGKVVCPAPYKQRWVGGPCRLITKDQYEIAKELGGPYYATRFFVVQGGNGGHKVDLSPAERSLLGSRGMDIEMPKMGALPYAEPTDATWNLLRGYDQLWTWEREQSGRSFADRTPADIEAMERERAIKAAEQQMDLIDAQIEGWFSEHGRLLKQTAQAERGEWGEYRGMQGSVADQDVAKARFIESQKSRLY